MRCIRRPILCLISRELQAKTAIPDFLVDARNGRDLIQATHSAAYEIVE
jgi:hypothetical protein